MTALGPRAEWLSAPGVQHSQAFRGLLNGWEGWGRFSSLDLILGLPAVL